MNPQAESAEELGSRLLPEHKIFADTYVETKSKRLAAKAAGASTNEAALTSYGYRVYRRPDVRAYMDAVWRESSMSAREVIERLSDVAALDLTPILDVSESGVLVINGHKALELGYTRFLKAVGLDSNGNPKYEFLDPQAAQLAIGRAHKLFGDKNELSGPDGGSIPVEMQIVFVDPPEGQQEHHGSEGAGGSTEGQQSSPEAQAAFDLMRPT